MANAGNTSSSGVAAAVDRSRWTNKERLENLETRADQFDGMVANMRKNERVSESSRSKTATRPHNR